MYVSMINTSNCSQCARDAFEDAKRPKSHKKEWNPWTKLFGFAKRQKNVVFASFRAQFSLAMSVARFEATDA